MTEASSSTTRTGQILSQGEKWRILLLFAAIAIITALALTASAVVGHISPVLSGLGIVAYVLGLRHGVDADHIAAIDNATRKLLQQGKPRFTVGTWFSLGHSTIVVGLIAAVVFATRAVVGQIPALQSLGSVLGTAVSGTFLFVMGSINLLIVLGVYRLFKQARTGSIREKDIEGYMQNRGFLNRAFRPLFRFVNEAWQIYPIGVLFGLGFDTATEVALIGISVGVGVSSAIPLWQVLVLPLMFTCGMVLTDTTDGVTMRFAYGWAFTSPLKRIYYNLTVTVMSVVVAFVVGGIELIQVLSIELDLGGPLWQWFNNLDFETMGFAIVGVFLATWTTSYVVWRQRGYGQLSSSHAGVPPGI